MTPLKNIRSIPKTHRDLLAREFGVTTAEAFFELALENLEGVAKALGVSLEEAESLRDHVEACLAPEFIKACRKPRKKRPRGVIVD